MNAEEKIKNDEAVELHLSEVTIKQMTWKPSITVNIAIAIVQYAMAHRNVDFWPDEIPLPELGKNDKNCIGTTWKNLAKQKIIVKAGGFRRSDIKKRKESNGRTIFSYKLLSVGLGRKFLTLNKVFVPDPQQELGIN